MKVGYASKFSKDLDNITDEETLERIAQVIEHVKDVQKPTDISNIKKIKNTKNAFRIRIGNYRIGVFIQKDVVIFTRVALRKDIYDIFP